MPNTPKTVADTMKELLPDPTNKIRLDDFVTEHIKSFLVKSDLTHFPVQGVNVSDKDFIERIKQYEEIIIDLRTIVILLARWGESEQIQLLKKIFGRLAETDKGAAGLTSWIKLGWYPLQILMYSAGIAALSTENYSALRAVVEIPTNFYEYSQKNFPLIVPVFGSISSLNNLFKSIPGQEQKHTPRSDYFLGLLRNPLEELLFLGTSYDTLFDEFETFSSLLYMDATQKGWGPLGRFAWKYYAEEKTMPLDRMMGKVKEEGVRWGPLQVGLFQGSQERFNEIAEALNKQIKESHWW